MTKSAIVTGSSRGIGRAIALRLAADGFAVVVNYAGNQVEADKVVGLITASGGQAIAVQADVAKSAEVAMLFEKTEQAFGGVDVLVNNAGVLKMLPLAQHDDALFDQTININLRGTFNTMRVAAAKLRDGGRVINFSSTAIALSLPGYAVYNASKAAVESLTKVFAKEMRGRQITVNAVAPGPVETELFLEGKTEAQIEQFTKMPPLERLGQPEDIANVVAFLASKESGWINGQVIRANGGIA